MNKTDVIRAVSEKTGIDAGTCEKVIKAFEEQIDFIHDSATYDLSQRGQHLLAILG
jgi:nucleoid DNA-binding protein